MAGATAKAPAEAGRSVCKVLDRDRQSSVYTLQKRQPSYPRATGRVQVDDLTLGQIWCLGFKGIFSAKNKGAANYRMGESGGGVLSRVQGHPGYIDLCTSVTDCLAQMCKALG